MDKDYNECSENETYLSADGKKVIKLNDFRYADDNLTIVCRHEQIVDSIRIPRHPFLGSYL